MTEEPATNMVDEVQNIAGGLTGVSNNEAEEEEKNDNESQNAHNNEEEDEHIVGEEEEDKASHQGELEKLNDDVTNKLIINEEEEEKAESQQGSVAVSEPKTASESGSKRPRRNKNKPTNQNIDVVIPDLPFAPQPKDPNIIHYIFEYEDEGTKRQTNRRGNSFTGRSKYQPVSARGSAPENGGSLYDHSPYFSKPISIYKTPVYPKTIRPNKTLTSRSRSTERNMSSTQHSNYSTNNSTSNGYGNNRSNYLSYSRRYSTRPPPPSNYVERTKEFEERQRRYNTEFTEKYKVSHPMQLYQTNHQKTVLQMKIEKQRREESRYKKIAAEEKKKRIKNRKIHEEFIKKTEDFGNEGEVRPKYLDNLDKRPNYLDLDFDLSEEEEKHESRSHSKQSSKTHNTENQSDKGKLENELDDAANGLLGNSEKKINEEEEETNEKVGEEEEDAKKDEEEEKKEEEEKNEDN